MPLTVAELKAEFDSTHAEVRAEIRELGQRFEALDHELRREIEARLQLFAAEVDRCFETLADKVGARELGALLEAVQLRCEAAQASMRSSFHADLASLREHTVTSLKELRAELGNADGSRPKELLILAGNGHRLPLGGDLPLAPLESERRDVAPLKDFVDGVNGASARSRAAVYVVAVASLVVFSTFWNIHPGSWLRERVRVAREAEELVTQLAAVSAEQKKNRAAGDAPESKLADSAAQTKLSAGNVHETTVAGRAEKKPGPADVGPGNLAANAAPATPLNPDGHESNPSTGTTVTRQASRGSGNPLPATTADASDREIHQSLLTRMISERRLGWLDTARKYRESLEEQLYVQAYQVKIPFFGLSFDINDLGMFSGFAFFVVLMILRFSLARELANLRLAFSEATARNQLRDCFKLLSMGQVLTVPRSTGVTSNPFTRNLHRTLYALPVLILGFIIYHDVVTLKSGQLFSTFNTVLSLLLSAGFFMINLILTFQCIITSLDFDATWDKNTPSGEAQNP
jgi:hypothetical protein